MYPRQGEGSQSQAQQAQRHWDQGYRGDPNQPLPPNANYHQTPGSQPPHANPSRPDMAAMHPQYHHPPPQQDYRLPPPGHFYPPPQQDMYRPQPPPVTNMNQTAPRQRTAIACKYCRRRKIRCSGFENSEDGRCSNCVRFSQECIFTPVSAQTQAFVPVQAVHGRGARAGGANGPQLYGSYGQPLRPQEQYPPYQQQGYAGLPSPTGGYPPPGQYMQPYPPPQQYSDPNAGRRRNKDEPHTPTLPPPNPGHGPQMGRHPDAEAPGYNYPDPTAFTNGATSPAGNPGSFPPGQGQPYYGQPQQPRRSSPGSAYSYGEPSRDSGSPYGSAAAGYGPPAQGVPPNHGQQPQGEGRTPPPHSGTSDQGGNRNGMAIRDIVSDTDRSATDKDMVSALNRPSNRR